MTSTEWIDGLKVAELKEELKKRDLAITGKKAELAARLRAHVEEQAEGADDAAAAEKAEDEINVDGGGGGEAEADGAKEDEAAAMEVEPAQLQEPEPADDAAPIPKARKSSRKSLDKPALEAPEPAVAPPPAPEAAPVAAAAAAPAKPPARAPASKQKEAPAKGGKPRPGGGAITMADISQDALTLLAEQTWSAGVVASGSAPAFDPALVSCIYAEELGGGAASPPPRRVAMLELSQYLENYLWPAFDPATSMPQHVLSIVLMVNEKFREGLAAWDAFSSAKDGFSTFFATFLKLRESRELTPSERLACLTFFANVFQSLENEMVRREVLRLVGLPLWHALSRGRLQLELHANPQLTRHWKHLSKKEAKAAAAAGDAYVPIHSRPEATFLPSLIADFLGQLEAATASGDNNNSPVDPAATRYCERFVQFLSDLLSQLPTRRFVHAILEDKAVLIKCYMSPLHSHPDGALFRQLVESFRAFLAFPIDDHTGDAQSEDAVVAEHYERVQQLQRLIFKHMPKLHDAALTTCGSLAKREVLTKFLQQLSPEELKFLVTRQLRLVDEADAWASNPAFLTEVMVAAYERRRPLRETIEAMPLYPTEAVLLDEGQVPGEGAYAGALDGTLALPKLNLQFLTLHDYFIRNFELFRLEAAYEVREDVCDAVRRTAPYLAEDDSVSFGGWARMAQTIEKFSVVEVRKPKVGENRPAAVTAEIVIDTRHMRGDVRGEWDQLKQHDVLFLLGVSPPDVAAPSKAWQRGVSSSAALRAAGLRHVRGCEVLEIRDQDGKLMNDWSNKVGPEEAGPPRGTVRTLTVALDTAQYAQDVAASTAAEAYSSFSLLMRRQAKENNFKAVLESIRDVVADEEAAAAVPTWLHDVILGYGDPCAAQYHNLDDECLHTVDFKDTFLDEVHLREAFPNHEIEFKGKSRQPPFRLTFPSFSPESQEEAVSAVEGGRRKRKGAPEPESSKPPAAAAAPKVIAESYSPPDPGPYPQDVPPLNTVRFTPVQASAILSGVQPGLTMVVGPPGTGKTDTAVQIMHILYHNCPSQRTLIITHSNQALNDLFQKIIERDVPARYLLRLGAGEADLETEEQFSRVGRVNAMLARRMELLAEVQRLARTLKVAENVAYTCETAAHFWLLHVLARWEKFGAAAKAARTPECVAELFPFKEYFADAPGGPLFTSESFDSDWSRAQGCFRHMRAVFQELEELSPFEVLRSQGDRINYLLTKQAKIVAMTCTHAALKRREFLELGFTYDNLLMEEAAQVLEVETALPLLLQNANEGQSRLKRVILIGDHHQLPPVVKNAALQKYSRLDQSLFTRFIRLGTPYIELNAQGRARPSLAKLYNWRYRSLGDLPRVTTEPAFTQANAGFAFDCQLVDVPDFLGRGETEPMPHFIQNLGEAEYLVSVYQYMRLLGYPAQSISILTTYNGQRALLKDVVERRCANHPAFGRPARITTVDKYQGQQNDYVLLSLVRTKHFGHLRDVRRLVVAMSRARLGMYVFARAGLFANCFELQPTFRQLLERPTQLALVAGEQHGALTRAVEDAPAEALMVSSVEHMASIVQQMGREWVAVAQAQMQVQAPVVVAVLGEEGAEIAGGDGAAQDYGAPAKDESDDE